MRKENHRPTSKNPGQALVEFALVLPLLLVLILGVIDFTRLITTKMVLTNVAREGASYISRNPDEYGAGVSEKTRSVINQEAQNITLENHNISLSCSNACEFGDTIEVTVTHGVDLIFGGFLQTLGLANDPFEVSSTVRMMVR